ncbi:MBL fold metallo-hydrolase [Devosia sp. MC532]|uniref:MBL fold metallo-hydrolase n=1 Tax=Devosia sp. MC532 TaxID=2799788 RepID=UPI0018F648D7|nr:MBL fold metallo-hydrolase [Devosia sp. MC532]MBJ7576398.1 MBL fold metallo-hydrolase [Devosia sp. MC532]
MAKPDRIIATILGCASSGGVPRLGNIWGACDPLEPRNRRTRCALLVEAWQNGVDEPTRVLIDTGADMREQLLAANVGRLDAVLYSHEHADHTHGIDDLRVLALQGRKRVAVYYSEACGERLNLAFGYCFKTPAGSSYPPILDAHVIADGETVSIDGPGGMIDFLAFDMVHGDIMCFGFRVEDFAYCCDLSALPQSSEAGITGLKTLIIDALRPTPHPSHLSLPEALDMIERFAPQQGILTNLHIDLDYHTTDEETPPNVTPAFDGMCIDVLTGHILNR